MYSVTLSRSDGCANQIIWIFSELQILAILPSEGNGKNINERERNIRQDINLEHNLD